MAKGSIYTLADELGVSPSTVSRALNNSPKISEKRRREIKELAREKGFKLRDFAPRLTNICILICTTSNDETIISSYSEEIINGVNRYCTDRELELSIFSSPIEKLNRINVVKELFRRNVDGVIVVNATDECTFIAQLESEKIPYCCLLSGNPDFPKNILTVNNEDLAERAVSYLIQLGHRNIAFLHSGPHNPAQTNRFKGYRNALAKAGLTVNADYAPEIPETPSLTGIEYGYQATAELLSAHPEVTAIFAASTELCIGVRSACHRKGIRIPDDLSLLGCDNSVQAEYFCPSLTVIDIPNKQIGEAAAAWIHQRLKGKGSLRPPAEPWMHGNLIIRESTALPRK